MKIEHEESGRIDNLPLFYAFFDIFCVKTEHETSARNVLRADLINQSMHLFHARADKMAETGERGRRIVVFISWFVCFCTCLCIALKQIVFRRIKNTCDLGPRLNN